jgi:hypothetical protein
MVGAVLALGACSKEETSSNGGGTGGGNNGGGNNGGGDPQPSTTYFFHGEINGTYTLLEDTKEGYTIGNGSQDQGNVKRLFSTLAKSDDKNSLEITMIEDLGKSNPSINEVYGMFSQGNKDFSDGDNNGIVVNWKDETGKTWTSNTKFGTSNSSQLNITHVGSFIGNTKTFKVEGTINCRVYDLIGDYKTIENGKFSVYFDATK